VLVVDDNADMREYMRRLLAGRGYEVEAVADGVAALEAARQRRPDLVLSDVMMPRLDGFGLLRTLRAEPALAEVPVVLLSARAGEEARVEGLDAGADDYLIKPFSARELVARIGASLSLTRVRREAAEEVRARSVELEAVLATVPAGVWFTRDADARRVWGNRHAAELLRLPEGANASLAAPEEERPSFRVFRDGVEATPETLPMLRAARGEEVRGDEQEIRFADGAPPVVLLCHATPLRDGEGRAAGAVCAAVDITDRRRAEEAQRESETRLLDLLATLDLGASMARDLDGTIRFWSEGCARLYGWSTAEVAGRDAHALLRTVFPVPQAEIEAALEREGEWIGDLRQWTRDGRGVIVAARKMLRRAADGRPVAVLESLTDVTAQRQAEAALVEALEAREVLLHEVNHRVKNSLQLVSSLLSLQASRSADQDLRAGLAEARGRIGVVSQVHRRLYQAGTHGRIDDLASFLQELCDDTVAALDQEGRISLEFAAPADEGAGAERAPIDRAVPLALILSELVTNAVKYAFPDGRGGTIRVSVRRVEEEGGALVVSVEDDGIGLPEGFEPIASRGVGMRVVVVLVRQLRARLEVRRTYPEGGASFVVVMPPTEPGADDAAAEGA
jgi:PAS domain S-box-containing protein